MRLITRTFMRGLVVLVPILVAVYVIAWIAGDSERAIRGLLLTVLPERYYVPGMGIVVMAGVVLLVGLLMYPWLTRKLFNAVDRVLRRIPLFGSIYSPVRDLMNLLGGDLAEQLGQPVVVEIPGTDIKTLGFITRDSVDDLPEGLNEGDRVVVYVQWSSQIGGYCFLVPREKVTAVDLTVQQGMQWALTAGVSLSGPVQRGPKDAG